MKLSTRDGASLGKKSADHISFEEEEELWTQGLLGDSNPDQLRDTLFFLNGIHFALRGGEEQSNLLLQQFSIELLEGKRILRYRDIVSKTYSGGLGNMRNKVKDVIHHENPDNLNRCHIRLYEKFLSLRPPGVERYYLQTAKSWQTQSLWYTTRPVGKNILSKIVKTMCTAAGISGNMRNHSLKATCATRLYQANIDEQQIMERTGHRSTIGVRAYKRTANVQVENCSAILDGRTFTELAKAAKSSMPQGERVSCIFNFKDCNVTINQ
jgi:hypothetical protein